MFFQYEGAFDDAYLFADQIEVHVPETSRYVQYSLLK